MAVPTPDLLAGFSLEITGKDGETFGGGRLGLPAGTRVNVTYLGSEPAELRRAAALAVARAQLTPVPHLAARRLASVAALDSYLAALHADGTGRELLVMGGDPAQPEGPFADALAVIRSGALARHGVARVSVCGYPEGHPAIPTGTLWSSLAEKLTELAAQDRAGEVVTQFSFDPARVTGWLAELRQRGIAVPVRVGVPGPAGVKRLLGYARRFGAGTSATIVRKYGLSLGNLLSVAGPDRFINELAEQLDPDVHGVVRLHFYTFGGVAATADWVSAFRAGVGHEVAGS